MEFRSGRRVRFLPRAMCAVDAVGAVARSQPCALGADQLRGATGQIDDRGDRSESVPRAEQPRAERDATRKQHGFNTRWPRPAQSRTRASSRIASPTTVITLAGATTPGGERVCRGAATSAGLAPWPRPLSAAPSPEADALTEAGYRGSLAQFTPGLETRIDAVMIVWRYATGRSSQVGTPLRSGRSVFGGERVQVVGPARRLVVDDVVRLSGAPPPGAATVAEGPWRDPLHAGNTVAVSGARRLCASFLSARTAYMCATARSNVVRAIRGTWCLSGAIRTSSNAMSLCPLTEVTRVEVAHPIGGEVLEAGSVPRTISSISCSCQRLGQRDCSSIECRRRHHRPRRSARIRRYGVCRTWRVRLDSSFLIVHRACARRQRTRKTPG
jgi:hypothetical protein